MRDVVRPIVLYPEDGRIDYPSGHSLEFRWEKGSSKRDDEPNPGQASFYYRTHKKTVKLNDLLPKTGNWSMVPSVPVYDGNSFNVLFYWYDVELMPHQVLLDVKNLKNEAKILYALHEIGHAHASEQMMKSTARIMKGASPKEVIKHPKLRELADETKIKQGKRWGHAYKSEIIKSKLMLESIIGKDAMTIHEERESWAYALRMVNKLGMDSWIPKKKIMSMYKEMLASYTQP
jgi:hypothetical protein